MKNVEMEVKENKLLIEVDLTQDHGPSKSGKTNIVATTAGNVAVPGNNSVRLGLNVYKYSEEE